MTRLDAIREAELYLGRAMQDLHMLWEPGQERDEREQAAVDYAVAYVHHVTVTFGGRSRR